MNFLIALTTNDQPLQKSGIGHARGQPGCIVTKSCRDNGHWLFRKAPVFRLRYPPYGFRVLNRIQLAVVCGLQNRRGSCLNGSAICDAEVKHNQPRYGNGSRIEARTQSTVQRGSGARTKEVIGAILGVRGTRLEQFLENKTRIWHYLEVGLTTEGRIMRGKHRQ